MAELSRAGAVPMIPLTGAGPAPRTTLGSWWPVRVRVRGYLAFDAAIIALGLALTVLEAVESARSSLPPGWALLILPVIVGLAVFPLVLSTSVGDVSVGLDFGALVVLALLLPGDQALLLWAGGCVLAQLIGRRPLEHRLFNMGLGAVDGWVALAVLHLFPHVGRTHPAELAAVVAAAVVYFLTDLALTVESVSLESRTSMSGVLLDGSVLLSVTCFAGTASIGYLTAVVLRALPLWVTALLVVPAVTLLAAARIARRAGEDRVRLAGLFGAAQQASVATDVPMLLAALQQHARQMLRSPGVRLSDEPPSTSELGCRLPTEPERWLVAEPRPGGPYAKADRQALEALAVVAGEGLVRLQLTAETLALAESDPLTGLANRSLFRDTVRTALSACSSTSLVAVVFCDLDAFKAVNDRFGHEVGDAVLTVIAERLRHSVRAVDLVARLGGDEFAILLQQLPDEQHAEQAAARVLAALLEPVNVAERQLDIRGSVGMAVARPDEDDSTLLGNADLAMYRAKALGKGRVEVFERQMRSENVARLELVDQLRLALAREEFVVYYQPVVQLADGRVDGFEALVRWMHPERGMVGPDVFIAACEEAGLIGLLGEQVLARAWEDGCRLGTEVGRPLTLGINVSACQLQDDALLEQLRALPRGPCSPLLVLEVTETALLEDVEGMQARLAALKGTGALLALDDFGTGYSSVAYLRQFPFDICKIDRSFVTDLVQDARASALLTAVLAMCHSLDVVSLAEGVEDPHQAALLQAAGCLVAQGFLYGHPVPVEQARAVLLQGRVDLASVPGQRRDAAQQLGSA